jgi:hypothetical protein
MNTINFHLSLLGRDGGEVPLAVGALPLAVAAIPLAVGARGGRRPTAAIPRAVGGRGTGASAAQ